MISIIPILFSKQNLVESSEWIELHNNNNEIEASLSTVHTIHTPVPTQKNIVVWLTTRFPGAEIDARETFVIFFWYGVGCHWFFSAQLKGYWFSTHQRSSQILLWFLCIVQVFLANVFAMFITWNNDRFSYQNVLQITFLQKLNTNILQHHISGRIWDNNIFNAIVWLCKHHTARVSKYFWNCTFSIKKCHHTQAIINSAGIKTTHSHRSLHYSLLDSKA